MKHWRLSSLLMAMPMSLHAAYADKILKPWVGASQEELVAKWGYPQSANDLFNIDEDTVVFTYRSFRNGPGGPAACTVSFTMKAKKVIAWKYEGANCPRLQR